MMNKLLVFDDDFVYFSGWCGVVSGRVFCVVFLFVRGCLLGLGGMDAFVRASVFGNDLYGSGLSSIFQTIFFIA